MEAFSVRASESVTTKSVASNATAIVEELIQPQKVATGALQGDAMSDNIPLEGEVFQEVLNPACCQDKPA